METKGGFYITQIKQLQNRIFERLLLKNGIINGRLNEYLASIDENG